MLKSMKLSQTYKLIDDVFFFILKRFTIYEIVLLELHVFDYQI